MKTYRFLFLLLMAAALAKAGPLETPELTIFSADGPVKIVASEHQFREWLKMTSLYEPLFSATFQAPPCVSYCGPDAGTVGNHSSPYCDDSSAWVGFRRTLPTSAFTEVVPTGASKLWSCGGVFGIAYEYDIVALSSHASPEILANFLEDGCYSVSWQFHADGLCPHSLDYEETLPDTFPLSWRARGWGTAASFRAGGYQLDFFLGYDAAECYDLPPGFPADGFACP